MASHRRYHLSGPRGERVTSELPTLAAVGTDGPSKMLASNEDQAFWASKMQSAALPNSELQEACRTFVPLHHDIFPGPKLPSSGLRLCAQVKTRDSALGSC